MRGGPEVRFHEGSTRAAGGAITKTSTACCWGYHLSFFLTRGPQNRRKPRGKPRKTTGSHGKTTGNPEKNTWETQGNHGANHRKRHDTAEKASGKQKETAGEPRRNDWETKKQQKEPTKKRLGNQGKAETRTKGPGILQTNKTHIKIRG